MSHPNSALDDIRWAAVQNRTRSSDRDFVYAVISTGIFCKPTCAARRPKRKNVLFFDTPQQAASEGFRACKRCKPEQSTQVSEAEAIVEQLATIIRDAIEEGRETPSLSTLAKSANWSSAYTQRTFKAILGVSPKAFSDAEKAKRFRKALSNGGSVTNAIYEAGYSSSSRLYERSDDLLGMTPTTYQQGGQGTTIRFSVGESKLGSILVASTQKGVCAVFLGDDPELLIHDLENQFPNANLLPHDSDHETLVAHAIALVEEPWRSPSFPLDLQGTAFRQRVWQALRKIRSGATLTYSDLAKLVGNANASRAVASACAANPVAIAIPCHRVVCKDGSPSGYRWGIERKVELLRQEREHS